jgi:hypothetical protein
MRKVFYLFSTMALLSLVACGQTEKKVSEKVKAAFSEKFPDAKKVKWDYEENEGWEAEFKLNGVEYSTTCDEDGEWLETEHEVDLSEIPPVVKATLDIEFKDYKVEESEISETASGKVYEFEIEKGKIEIEVVIDPEGKIVKQESFNEEEDDD